MTDLAPSAAAVTRRLIELLDARLPGQLEALYLVGSIALRDYQEGVSDVDFIAVLPSRMTPPYSRPSTPNWPAPARASIVTASI